MRRLFWIAAGAAAGIYAVRRVQRTAVSLSESLSPQGVAASLSAALRDLGEAIREFSDEVRAGMAEREIELREALGLGDDEPVAAGSARPDARASDEW
ncbi:MAG: DUF6167 family protein [Frankiaceae bacterium]